MKICFTFLLTFLFHPVVTGKTYDILAYGAEADGKTINTKAIQKAIDACTPGDTVYIQNGHYLTGTVHLKSNITLYISKEGFLIGSTNINDYEAYSNRPLMRYGMLVANNIINLNISGPGTIEANGSAFMNTPTLPRQIMLFVGCRDITIQNISALNIPFNGIEFRDCAKIKALNLKLWGSSINSGKGIDLYNCNNSHINGCHIRSGQSAVAVSGLSGQIVINNSSLQSNDNAISILSANSNSVKNVSVRHVNITKSGRGIYLSVSDSASLEDINFTDLSIETKQHSGDSLLYGEPVYVSVSHNTDSAKSGTIKNISFDNILCNAENQIMLSGASTSLLQDVRFDNVVLNIHNPVITAKPTYIPASAVSAAYVSVLSISNIAVSWPVNQSQAYIGNGIAVNNFKNFKLSNYSVTATGTNTHAVSLTDGDHAIVDAGDVFKLRVTEPKPIKVIPKAKTQKPAPAKTIARL